MIKDHKFITAEQDNWSWFDRNGALKQHVAQLMTDLKTDELVALVRRAHSVGFNSGTLRTQCEIKNSLGIR